MSNLNIQLTDLLTSHPQLISQADLDWWENLSDYWKELLSEYPYAYHKEFSQEFVDENHPLVLAKMTKGFIFDSYADLEDISPLSHLTQLEKLNLIGVNKVSNISPLTSLKNLKHLEIFDGSGFYVNFPVLSEMPQLEYLSLFGTNFDSLDFLTGLVNLEFLQLGDIDCDLPDLSNLTKLKELDICAIGSLYNVKTIPNLQTFRVFGINGIEGVLESNIKDVYINYNALGHLDPEEGYENFMNFLINATHAGTKIHFEN